jgi:aminoglycoside phosphotransferase (APT) family kinase protein
VSRTSGPPCCRLLHRELPLEQHEIHALQQFTRRFKELCEELVARGVPETLQHDDLHMSNLFVQDDTLRIVDWGDASVSHPFASLVETFRFLEEFNGLKPGDEWFSRLRDAYLEPWVSMGRGTFALALRVGAFAHAFAWARQRDYLSEAERASFDRGFAGVLRRAISQMTG